LNLSCGVNHVYNGDVEFNRDIQRAFLRKHELFIQFNDMSPYKPLNDSSELDRFIIKREEGGYKCNCCIKAFTEANYVRDHLKNKHNEIIDGINDKLILQDMFVDNMDFLLISAVLGIDDNYLPNFMSVVEGFDGVRYSTKIFSGEIKIPRRR
jgi:hypothetical protein